MSRSFFHFPSYERIYLISPYIAKEEDEAVRTASRRRQLPCTSNHKIKEERERERERERKR